MIAALHSLRLAAFPLGLGLTSVLVSGTLNRVMIVELALPAALVGLFLALPVIIAPARIWLGYLSDGHPLRGKRREPYIVLGTLIAGLGLSGATLIALKRAAVGPVLIGGGTLAFLAFGLGHTLASNTFEALLADKFTGAQRPRAVTLFKIAMFGGILGGALGLGALLDPFSHGRLLAVVGGVALAYAALATLAVARQEPAVPHLATVAQRAASEPFLRVVRTLVWSDPQARRFFAIVVFSVLGTLAQDVLLEPYGALVLGMSVAQTTRLTALWGTGTILAMALAGVWLIARWGYLPVLRVGLGLNAAVFGGMLMTGALGQVAAFRALVLLLGVGTGLSMTGLLTAVIEFTTFERAGLLMGVWGTAAELGQASGGVLGGMVVDGVRHLSGGNALLAYGTVFVLESLLLLFTLTLTRGLRVGVALSSEMRAAAARHLWEEFTPAGR
jgi:BCD family chlorophyll transporter-like MFS transporter